MIKVHNLENSQSIRIIWLLEELGVDYEIVQYKRRDQGKGLAPSDYKKLHPAGTSPTISHGDTYLAETNAIVDYILDLHPDDQLRPKPESPDRTQYLYWFHATQGSLMPLLLDSLIFKRMESNAPFFIRPVIGFVVNRVKDVFLQPRLTRIFKYINSELEIHPWLAGENFTAADIVMGYCLEVAEVRSGMLDDYPNILNYLRRMRERAGYQRAIEKNGPFRPIAE